MRRKHVFYRTRDKREDMNPSLCQRCRQWPGYCTAHNLLDQKRFNAGRPLDWTFIRDVNLVP